MQTLEIGTERPYLRVISVACPKCSSHGAKAIEMGVLEIIDSSLKTKIIPKGIESLTCPSCGVYEYKLKLKDVVKLT